MGSNKRRNSSSSGSSNVSNIGTLRRKKAFGANPKTDSPPVKEKEKEKTGEREKEKKGAAKKMEIHIGATRDKDGSTEMQSDVPTKKEGDKTENNSEKGEG